MNEQDFKNAVQKSESEADFLRARSDALFIALKVVVQSLPNHGQVMTELESRLNDTSAKTLYSGSQSDAYLHGFDAAVERIFGWRAVPRDAG
ncbi:hypothetical protein [Pandoraea sp. SD6-2]|uniref:hypothetical protein n=1 Tax=Pandoraea sp. SD6-2 TaxID=1286093 RepID=UPI00032F4F0C|nr:hypothetical protein [Pandoraea sp. SD6-2]EON11934.1 hypothetical protein C266_19163 [Pandoraea sp. SD6-2]